MNKVVSILLALALVGALVAGCGPTPTPVVVTQQVIVKETVPVESTVIVQQTVEVPKIVTATPLPEARELEIFHWWTAPGEREAADAMFATLKAKYPDIKVVENPVAGGGGVSHRVVLQGRMAAGLPPDTFQTLGGAELKAYVDGNALEPLDWLRVVASPELQIPTDVVQGGLFARIDIDPTEFPDPIRQEMAAYVAKNPGKLILDQHGSIAPAAFSNEYWITLAGFMTAPNPDVAGTLAQVKALMDTYEVKKNAAWYNWP